MEVFAIFPWIDLRTFETTHDNTYPKIIKYIYIKVSVCLTVSLFLIIIIIIIFKKKKNQTFLLN